jgi:hypothetical protein
VRRFEAKVRQPVLIYRTLLLAAAAFPAFKLTRPQFTKRSINLNTQNMNLNYLLCSTQLIT